MILPKPPTDNIYKFGAISGLVMAILSVGYSATEVRSLEREGVRLQGELALLEAEIDFIGPLLEDKTQQAKEPERNDEQQQSGDLPSPSLDSLDPIRQQELDFRIRLETLKNKANAWRLLLDQVQAGRWFVWVGGVGGPVMFVLCSYLWITRIQVYQDIILRAEAEKAREELNQKKGSS